MAASWRRSRKNSHGTSFAPADRNSASRAGTGVESRRNQGSPQAFIRGLHRRRPCRTSEFNSRDGRPRLPKAGAQDSSALACSFLIRAAPLAQARFAFPALVCETDFTRMGRIHVLPEHVANKIAAGEVVERPASVVKELLENSLDAGSSRIRIQVEAGGKKLIQITDDGCGMVRDDALLAFERHATSKIKNAEDLLNISTLGFRGEALPSIASVCRLRLETRAPDQDSGTMIEITGGKIFRVEEAGLPAGTSITIRDLFFNIPARKKFLKAESTELSHIASLVTHYAMAHPDKHFELHSATNAMLVAPPVAGYSERVYQVFGKETLDQLIPIASRQPLERVGLPQPPPWRRAVLSGAGVPSTGSGQAPAHEAVASEDPIDPEPESFGEMHLHGFVSKPEIQKL